MLQMESSFVEQFIWFRIFYLISSLTNSKIKSTLFQVESASEQSTYISTAYDFYRNTYSQPLIKWINLYKNANMISYNAYDKRIYIYDHGYMLSVPPLLHWLAK